LSDAIGQRLKSLRVGKRWKQRELGDNIGVSSQVISNWERGYSFPKHEDTAKLATALGTTADFLLRGDNGRKDEGTLTVTEIDLILLRPEQNIYIDGTLLTEEEKNSLLLLIEGLHARRLKRQISKQSSY